MPTRQQYMDHDVTHRQYYAQYVTPGIKRTVLAHFGLDKLKTAFATDQHFNSIPLKAWDIVGQCANTSANHKLARDNGSWISQSYLVCIVKEAAHQLVEEA